MRVKEKRERQVNGEEHKEKVISRYSQALAEKEEKDNRKKEKRGTIK